MMQESLIGEFCRPWLDHRRYQRRIPAALPGTVGAISVGTFASVSQHGLPSWVSPDVPVTGRVPRRAETRHIAPLTALRRIVAAIRLWRWHARSRQ
jgi:hypothetical protein